MEKVVFLRKPQLEVNMPDISHLPKCMSSQSNPVKSEVILNKQTRFRK